MKRRCLSLETKVMLIEKVGKKCKSKAEICREHNIPPSTLQTIIKYRDNIISAFTSGEYQRKRMKIRRPGYDDIDRALHKWFLQAMNKNIPISGPVLIEKGNEIAESLGYTNLSLSNGWLNRFKARHGIEMNAAYGGLSLTADHADIDNEYDWSRDSAPINLTTGEHLPEDETFASKDPSRHGISQYALKEETIIKDEIMFSKQLSRHNIAQNICEEDVIANNETVAPKEEHSKQDITNYFLRENDDAKDEDACTSTQNPPCVTAKEAFKAVETLQMYLMQQADSSIALTILNCVEKFVDDFAKKASR